MATLVVGLVTVLRNALLAAVRHGLDQRLKYRHVNSIPDLIERRRELADAVVLPAVGHVVAHDRLRPEVFDRIKVGRASRSRQQPNLMLLEKLLGALRPVNRCTVLMKREVRSVVLVGVRIDQNSRG